MEALLVFYGRRHGAANPRKNCSFYLLCFTRMIRGVPWKVSIYEQECAIHWNFTYNWFQMFVPCLSLYLRLWLWFYSNMCILVPRFSMGNLNPYPVITSACMILNGSMWSANAKTLKGCRNYILRDSSMTSTGHLSQRRTSSPRPIPS